jgi:hypothetical protein
MDRTTNRAWRNLKKLGSAEYDMKKELRQGNYTDLNLYFTTIAPYNWKKILGYAFDHVSTIISHETDTN